MVKANVTFDLPDRSDQPRSEAAILAEVRIALSKAGVSIFRNNQGVLPDRNGRPVHFGVCNPGGSDLLGYQSILITSEMVGKRVAVFTGVEVKTTSGKATAAQKHFLETVAAAGGTAILARSPEQALAAVAAPKFDRKVHGL